MFLFQHLCRQGRDSVQVTYELDVVFTEYVEHESTMPAGDVTRDGSVRPIDVNSMLRGRLHLRMANVGHPADPKLKRERAPMSLKAKSVVSTEAGVTSFLGGSLNAINVRTKSMSSNLCTAFNKSLPIKEFETLITL